MFDEDNDDINYSDMDDLPLSDHIEWQHSNAEDTNIDDLDEKAWIYV